MLPQSVAPLLMPAVEDSASRSDSDVHQAEDFSSAKVLYKQAVEVAHRFMRSGNMEDLEESVTLNQEALTLRPAGHPNRLIPLINIANAVMNLFKQTG